MLGKRLGIDLGAGTLRVVARGEAQVLTEPSLVARHRSRGYAAAGEAAAALAGDPEMELIRPVRGGAIADREALSLLLQRAVNRAAGRQRIFRPDAVVAICPRLSSADRLHILEVCARLGTRTVYLIDTPLAAVMGAGHSPAGPRAHLIVDVGAGSVDVACLAQEGTVAGQSLTRGGEWLRAAVSRRLEEVHHDRLDATALEAVVSSLACVGPHEERRMPVRTGAEADPEDHVSVTSHEIADLVDEHARGIAAQVREVIDQAPSALRRDLLEEGITLCGGGARLEGLERFLGVHTGCPARTAADPQGCVIRGTQLAVESLDVLRRSFVYIR